MGAADKIRCDVSGYSFSSISVRECPEPNVIRRYGSGGVAHVSVYVCRKCRYAIPCKFFGGLTCALDQKAQKGPVTGKAVNTKRGD